MFFLTGATGWVGATVAELLAAGHPGVSGLARNPGKALALLNAGGRRYTGRWMTINCCLMPQQRRMR